MLAAQRSASMSFALKWEFPGGKIDPGESPKDCLHRELMEEMSVSVEIRASLPSVTHRYPDFSVTLYPFVCTIASGNITLHEHAAVNWLAPDTLNSLDWLEADFAVIDLYLSGLGTTGKDRVEASIS